MGPFPPRDRSGNVLRGFRFTTESDLERLDDSVPLPLSLVVVSLGDRVLMMLNRWRDEWELPGGLREPGETPRQAAVRELAEETGVRAAGLDFAAIVEFDLRDPDRREYGAVYRTTLAAPPRLVANDEAADFLWWHPNSPLADRMNVLDAEIARLVAGGR